MSITPKEEAAGYRLLLQAWKRDARHYEAGMRAIRKYAQLNRLPEVVAMVDEIMSFDKGVNVIVDEFWGREIKDWEDIYSLLMFQGKQAKSFADLVVWRTPESPQGCVNLAFDIIEARAAKYENPVRKWIECILTNGRRDHTNINNAPSGREVEL